MTPTLLTGNFYAVEVPECMNAFKIECRPEIDFYVLNCYQIGEYDEPIREDTIDLPAGSWEFIGTPEDIPEDLAATIVERQDDGYKDYSGGFHYDIPCVTAVDSLRGLGSVVVIKKG